MKGTPVLTSFTDLAALRHSASDDAAALLDPSTLPFSSDEMINSTPEEQHTQRQEPYEDGRGEEGDVRKPHLLDERDKAYDNLVLRSSENFADFLLRFLDHKKQQQQQEGEEANSNQQEEVEDKAEEETKDNSTVDRNDKQKEAKKVRSKDSKAKRREHKLWSPPEEPSLPQMRELLLINCLVKGAHEEGQVSGKRYMVPVDNTEGSCLAFRHVLGLTTPRDHVFIIHVRFNPFHEYSTQNSSETKEHYKRWKYAVQMCYPLKKALDDSKLNYTILVPVHHDPRKLVCQMALQFKVDVIVVGRHTRRDKASGTARTGHLRSFNRYVKHHAYDSEVVVI